MSSDSPMTSSPPVRAWMTLSMPSRSGVPGGDHVQGPQQAWVLARLKLVQLIRGSQRHAASSMAANR